MTQHSVRIVRALHSSWRLSIPSLGNSPSRAPLTKLPVVASENARVIDNHGQLLRENQWIIPSSTEGVHMDGYSFLFPWGQRLRGMFPFAPQKPGTVRRCLSLGWMPEYQLEYGSIKTR